MFRNQARPRLYTVFRLFCKAFFKHFLFLCFRKNFIISKAITTKHSSKTGGGKRNRTADLLHAMQALYQLSYTPKTETRV
jgi:hypothetical protein